MRIRSRPNVAGDVCALLLRRSREVTRECTFGRGDFFAHATTRPAEVPAHFGSGRFERTSARMRSRAEIRPTQHHVVEMQSHFVFDRMSHLRAQRRRAENDGGEVR